MPDNAARDHLVQELSDVLDETFENVRGIYLDRNTSLFETLDTISAEEASHPVSATCACIAAQVEHVRFYLHVLESAMRGQELGKIDWEASWLLTQVSPEAWDALKERLRATYQSVQATIKRPETWEDKDAIGNALAIVVHTAYHLGEIRQALCTVNR